MVSMNMIVQAILQLCSGELLVDAGARTVVRFHPFIISGDSCVPNGIFD